MARTDDLLVSRSPFDGSVVGEFALTPLADVPARLDRAEDGFRAMAGLSRHRRAAILRDAADRIEQDAEGLAPLIAREVGKPIAQARGEVRRAAHTLRLCAAEATTLGGEELPFDSFPGKEGLRGYFRYRPLGTVLAITPYNDPLNLIAHKIGPAVAVGNGVLLKPSEQAPAVARRLVDHVHAAGCPPNALQLVVGSGDIAAAFVAAETVRMVSFTGGERTAQEIVRRGGLKRYAMDLGGVAPVIVCGDADIERAAQACVAGGFWANGQNCIGVQRVFVDRRIADRFADALVERSRALVVGDPLDPSVDVGPMIGETQAAFVEALWTEARQAGGRIACGGRREGNRVVPTVILDAGTDCALAREEAFGPILAVDRVDTLNEAIARANATRSSMQAGIFTTCVEAAWHALDRIEASGVFVNETSDVRLDSMPFGGFKYGSVGREGIAFAMREMSNTQVVGFALASPG